MAGSPKKLPPPRKEKQENHRNIQTTHPVVGGFWFPNSSYLRIARANDLVAGAGRVAQGAVKDTVGESPETQTTPDVGKAWVWYGDDFWG